MGAGQYFWVKYLKEDYWVHLECNLEPEKIGGLWRIAFRRKSGCLTAILRWNRRDGMSDSFRQCAENMIRQVAGANPTWMSEDDAVDQMYSSQQS